MMMPSEKIKILFPLGAEPLSLASPSERFSQLCNARDRETHIKILLVYCKDDSSDDNEVGISSDDISNDNDGAFSW